MNVDEFIFTRPCLEEIDGFVAQRKASGVPLTIEEMNTVEKWRRHLSNGRDVPAHSLHARGYEYKRGRKPIKLRKAIVQ